MNNDRHHNQIKMVSPQAGSVTLNNKGNLLVYMVVVLLIFAVLGVSLVSLFTTSTSSSATPNDAKRALYLAESGYRYALSRIRNANFYPDFIKEINDLPKYTLNNGSNFSINVFSPWFISSTNQDFDAGDNPFTLLVPNEGEIPLNFSIPDNNVFLVNWRNFKVSSFTSYAAITNSSTPAEAKTLTINLGDNLIASADDTTCLAVNCVNNGHTVMKKPSLNSYLFIAEEAKDFFPSKNGAIRILKTDDSYYDFFYDKLEHDVANNWVKLSNLAELPGASWSNITVAASDFVILSAYNYTVMTKGTSGDVTTEIGYDKQVGIFPHTGDWTITQREFIDSASPQVTDIVNPVAKTELGLTEAEDKIILGGSNPGFGDLWYGGDKTIGGDSSFCEGGQCRFQDGIRIFFTLDTSGDGEGFIFALIAAGDDGTGNPVNTKNSAGGDYQQGELLGYAGDSRINSIPQFLDEAGQGLKPPKIGLEFDTHTNFDPNFSLQRDYCDGAILKANTRNDPLPDGSRQDAVQYVFWGSEDPPQTLELSSCRNDSPNKETYDDNRHDAESFFVKWAFKTDGEIKSSPAVGSDGTIYVGSDDSNLYALNPDDRKRLYDQGNNDVTSLTTNEWWFDTGDIVRSSPRVVEDDTETNIYVGSDDNKFYALNLNGSEKWNLNLAGDPSLGRPNIGPNDNIYITNRSPSIFLRSVSPVAREAGGTYPQSGNEWVFNVGGGSVYMPGVDSNSGAVYSDKADRKLVAIYPEGNLLWELDTAADVRSTPQVGTDGTIYFTTYFNNTPGFETGEILAAESTTDGAGNPIGSIKWRYPGNTGGIGGVGNIQTTPALSNDQSVVYAVAGNEKLYALNTDPDAGSRVKWTFSPASGSGEIQSSPTVDPQDDTIYAASNEVSGAKIIAVNPDGTLRWSFDTPMDIDSTPTVDPNSRIVYVGCDDTNLYAINQVADPRSYRTEDYEEKKVVLANDFSEISFSNSENWLQEGPWAIRMEVTRDLAAGEGVYVLKAWVEKCTDSGCNKFLSAFYRDTLINYDVSGTPPRLEQTIKLSVADHDKFERFLLGFTTAVGSGDTQESIVKFFELSFIRPSDPTVTSDPNLEG